MEVNLDLETVISRLPLVKGADETYPFLAKVIERLLKVEKIEKLTMDQLNRAALVLLYVDYRAANFQLGERCGFSTLKPLNDYQKERFDFVNEIFDPVESTKNYCEALKIGPFKSMVRGLRRKSMEDHLFEHVTKKSE